MTKQHFGNETVYERISKEQARQFMEESIKIFFRLITKISKDKNKKRISYSNPKLEVHCMRRSMDLNVRTPMACGITKLHKGKGNLLPCRPVVAVVGSPFHFMIR